MPCLPLTLLALLAPPQERDVLQLGLSAGPDGAALAFVELALTRDTYLVHEPFVLRLRLGFEREFLDKGLLPLFQRELELPVQVQAPWLEELSGATALRAPEAADGPRLALAEQVVRARSLPEERRDGRTFHVFELERSYVAPQPGELELVAPLLTFAGATRFEDDFVHGRVALDRQQFLVRGAGARVRILPLPEEGRPPEYSGAIGRFTLQAEAEPRELEAGESLTLRLTLAGSGDLSQCEPPRLGALEGFHVLGSLVERGEGRLEVRYDLAPRGPEVRAVPPVRFAFFDTTPPAGYRVVVSEALPIRVRAQEPQPGAAPAARQGAGGVDPQAPTAARPRWPLVAGLALLVGVALAWLARSLRRAR